MVVSFVWFQGSDSRNLSKDHAGRGLLSVARPGLYAESAALCAGQPEGTGLQGFGNVDCEGRGLIESRPKEFIGQFQKLTITRSSGVMRRIRFCALIVSAGTIEPPDGLSIRRLF